MKATWLADVLRSEGLTVHEFSAWETRGREMDEILGVVAHHTATGPTWTNDRVRSLLAYGRSDLSGPLSQLGLRRDGSYDLIAAGKSNHNGYGTWGNQSIGIEAYNDGIGEDWTPEQIDAYDRGSAAILRHLGLPADRLKGHRETDPKRKIDPAGIDMDAMRARVARLLTTQPTPEPPKGPLMALTDAEQEELLTKVRELHADYAVKGKGVRQIIATIDKRTDDLVTGKRPGKG